MRKTQRNLFITIVMGDSAEWMVNKENRLSGNYVRQYLRGVGNRVKTLGAAGPLSQEALLAMKMADCSPIAPQR